MLLQAQSTLPLDPGLQIATIPLYSQPSTEMAQDISPEGEPTLTVFKPQPGFGTGSAVIIAPGGAYIGRASNLEGRQVADWFASRGFTAFVLNYRLGKHNLFPVPLLDAQRAIRLVRSLATPYSLSTNRIGIVGFSAGGHLAASAATLFDRQAPGSSDPVDALSARPDFLVLGYPWLNAMEPAIKDEITYCSVLHIEPPTECAALTDQYTPKLHVTSNTPSTFIFSTSDDTTVPVRASVEFYTAMIKAGAPVEMHLFRHGAHGSGLGVGDPALDLWPVLLDQWLRDQGLLTKDPKVATAAPVTAPARKAGEPLTLDSRIADILSDERGAAAVAAICGPDFLAKMPEEARQVSLRVIAAYSPEQLSRAKLDALELAFKRLSK
ncbi:MAG: alpha/beta hydrolase [Terracidiphilus sp.]